MSALYDYEPSPRNDPMVSIVDNYLRASVPGVAPGRILLVKVFPFRKCRWLNEENDDIHTTWESTPFTRLASRVVDQT